MSSSPFWVWAVACLPMAFICLRHLCMIIFLRVDQNRKTPLSIVILRGVLFAQT